MLVVYLLIAAALIIVVLFQSDQSMNLSGLVGGASQSAIGSKPKSVMTKLTTGLAVLFFLVAVFFAMVPPDEEGALSPGLITEPAGQPPAGPMEGPGDPMVDPFDPFEEPPAGPEQPQEAPPDQEAPPMQQQQPPVEGEGPAAPPAEGEGPVGQPPTGIPLDPAE